MINIRDKRQIKGIEKSCHLLRKMSELLVKYAVAGRATRELGEIADDFIYANSARPAFREAGFPASICTSVNDEVVHGIPGDYILQDGDILSLDMGLSLDGYYSDMAVTIGLGEISSVASNLIEVTRESLMKGISAFRPGNHLSDISHAISTFVEANGFSVVRQFTGHGIGTSLHEEPQILNFGPPSKGPILRNGMVFAIEPMVNEGSWEVYITENGWTAKTTDGTLSAHFEHTVALIDGKPRILTG